MLRGGAHQTIQRHELGEPPRARREARVGQDPVQRERLPQLMAHVDRASFPDVFGLDLIGVDGDHVVAAGGRRTRAMA